MRAFGLQTTGARLDERGRGAAGYRQCHPQSARLVQLSGQFCVESYGLIAPGMPQTAADIGLHYAHIAVSEEPLQATQFWTSLVALCAFHEGAIDDAFQQALAAVDPKSCMAEVVADARKAFCAHPDDWKAARQEIHGKWLQQRNGTTFHAGQWRRRVPRLALRHDDFYRTLQFAMALGYDADCNAATAGAVVGVRIGFQRIAALPQFKMPDRYVNKTRPQLPPNPRSVSRRRHYCESPNASSSQMAASASPSLGNPATASNSNQQKCWNGCRIIRMDRKTNRDRMNLLPIRTNNS